MTVLRAAMIILCLSLLGFYGGRLSNFLMGRTGSLEFLPTSKGGVIEAMAMMIRALCSQQNVYIMSNQVQPSSPSPSASQSSNKSPTQVNTITFNQSASTSDL
jgi:hypothetical protein